MRNSNKDVHTEHCCIYHGCKYFGVTCTVTSKEKIQSYPCEDCEWAKEEFELSKNLKWFVPNA